MTDISDLLNSDQFFPREAGLRGRNKPTVKYPLKWAHEYLKPGFSTEPVFPVDATEGLIDLGLMGNGDYGNCVSCAEVHIEMTTAKAAGTEGPTPDSPLAVERYVSAVGSSTPPGPGLDMAPYYLDLVRKGILKAFAPVDHTNKSQMQALMQLGFGIAIGVNLTDNNEAEFNSGQPFDPQGQPIDPEDGHAVVWAYSAGPDGPHKVGTWGLWWLAVDAWIEECLIQNPNGEAFLLVTTEEQLAMFEPALLTDVQALGGGAVAPEPAPAPPAPHPAPAPAPEPSNGPPPFPNPPAPLPAFYEEWWAALMKREAEVEAWIKEHIHVATEEGENPPRGADD